MTHSEVPPHARRPKSEVQLRMLTFQAAAPPVGLVEENTWVWSLFRPVPVVATQSFTVGQEIPSRVPGIVSGVRCQVAWPPAGFVEVAMTPLPMATQSDGLGHETKPAPRSGKLCHCDAPPVGLVEVQMVLLLPAPTHSVVLGQDMVSNMNPGPLMSVVCQAAGLPS